MRQTPSGTPSTPAGASGATSSRSRASGTTTTRRKRTTPATERVWRHVAKGGPDECWLWLGAKPSRSRYGHLAVGREGEGRIGAHVAAYISANGPLPPGMEPHHTCNVPLCCNPAHLVAKTHRANILIGGGIAARNARKTHCPQQHEYTEANTIRTTSGTRRCRTCHNERRRIRR